MRTLRIPIAMAASVIALFGASTSMADEAKQSTTTPAQTTQPAQPQIIVVQPPAQQPQAQQPVGTTRVRQGEFVTPPERERTEDRRPNRPMLSTGAGMFILSYAPSATIGALSDRPEDKRLFIPVAGPWMDLKERDCHARPCGENENINRAAIIASGVAQGAGALIAVGSLLIPEKARVEERTAKPSVKILPMSFGAGAGIGAIGRF